MNGGDEGSRLATCAAGVFAAFARAPVNGFRSRTPCRRQVQDAAAPVERKPGPRAGAAPTGQAGGHVEPDLDPVVRRRLVQDGVSSHVMATLTGGPFLVAYALGLGASNLWIGLIAAASPLAQVSQIPGVWIIEHIRDRRRITLFAAGMSRVLWVIVAAVAFLPGRWGLLVLLVSLTVHFMLGGIAGTSWNSWMRDLVPERTMGAFFARRSWVMHAVALPLFLLAGLAADGARIALPERPLVGYQGLFLLGAGAGIVGLWFLKRTPEPPMPPRSGPTHFREMLRRPLQDANFRRLLHFLIAWNFAFNLAAPFFTVYLLDQLGYPMTWVVGFSVLSQLVHLLFLRLWGRYIDHYGNRRVLLMSGPAFLFAVLAWTFTTFPDPHAYTLPLLVMIHAVLGATTAGTVLATGNIVLKLAPRGHGTSYLATAALAAAIAGGLGPLIGGMLADFFSTRTLDLTLGWRGPKGSWTLPTLSLEHWDFFFASAFVLGLYALHRLTAVHEESTSKDRVPLGVLFSDIRQEMRNLSTIGGMRALVLFPLNFVRGPLRPRRRQAPEQKPRPGP